jgi:alkylated DNA repair dioxygenase AlkB
MNSNKQICDATPTDMFGHCEVCPNCNHCKNKCWNYYGGWDYCRTYGHCECIISTEKSFLKTYTIDEPNLMPLCIDDIKDKLIVRPIVRIYGKTCIQHRSIGFFSNTSIGYKYSGQIAKSQRLTENLEKLLSKINTLLKADFNGILINKYDSGLDYISAHSDDERMLDPVGVVSISYGAERIFRIRNKQTKEIVKDIPTITNTLIHMGGDFQKEFTHEIPQQKKILEERYSFTFRKHLE